MTGHLDGDLFSGFGTLTGKMKPERKIMMDKDTVEQRQAGFGKKRVLLHQLFSFARATDGKNLRG